MKKRMTESIRQKISLYRKNRKDISDLIKDIDIKGEDLSGCIIKSFDRMNEDISDCNLSRCIIGEDKKITHLSRAIMVNCNFRNTVFKGNIWMRYVDARNTNFGSAFVPFVEYQHGDFRGCNFCDTVWRMGSRAGHDAKINQKLIDLWAIEISKE